MPDKNIVILGGGQAAANAIRAIRNLDQKCQVTLVSEEISLPYERPPLSKKCITGEKTLESCVFFDNEFYDNHDIELHLDRKVEFVDFQTRKLLIDKQAPIAFDQLLIATGSTNRVLPVDGLAPEQILYLRTMSESQAIVDQLQTKNRVLIIGGGFIGMELAASLRSLGKAVTVIEASSQLMGRAIPCEIAGIVQGKHEHEGVAVHLGATVTSVTSDGGSDKAQLSNGHTVVFDLIIVGIGIKPNLDPFADGDLHTDDGIVTDEYGRTSIDNVYAAGDVASFYHPHYDSYMRLESWKHAQSHGMSVGKNMAGESTVYNEIPWMWSEQYDYNLQLSGIASGYDACIKRGDSPEEGIVYFYLRGNRIIGACGVSIGPKIGRDIRVAGMLAKASQKVDPDVLSDTDQKLQSLLSK
jgi:3-phenylpropionate/trans-cinnamate dioxygenase ferredoxin reductase subunit